MNSEVAGHLKSAAPDCLCRRAPEHHLRILRCLQKIRAQEVVIPLSYTGCNTVDINNNVNCRVCRFSLVKAYRTVYFIELAADIRNHQMPY